MGSDARGDSSNDYGERRAMSDESQEGHAETLEELLANIAAAMAQMCEAISVVERRAYEFGYWAARRDENEANAQCPPAEAGENLSPRLCADAPVA